MNEAKHRKCEVSMKTENVPIKGPRKLREQAEKVNNGKHLEYTKKKEMEKKRLSSEFQDAVRVPIFIQQDLTFVFLYQCIYYMLYIFITFTTFNRARLKKTQTKAIDIQIQ